MMTESANVVRCRSESGVALPSKDWAMDVPCTFIYAPAGVHTITAGFRDGRVTMTVLIDEQTPEVLQASFERLSRRRRQTPFADEEHEKHKATIRFPMDSTRFSWGMVKDSEGVVLSGGLPTSYGADSVNGRVYDSWSPEFLTDADYDRAEVQDGHYTFPRGARGSESNPARLVGVGIPVGALTNCPAFHAMPSVKARQAGMSAAISPESEAVLDGLARHRAHVHEILDRLASEDR